MDFSSQPRILISRMSAIGDTILTLPLLCALRDRFPRAHISWVVEERAAPIVDGHADLDRLIILERLWFTSPLRLLRAKKRLDPYPFDISIDPQSRLKTSIAGWLSGAKMRIGFGGKFGEECSTLFNNRRVPPRTTHLVDRTLELLRPLGIEQPEVKFRLPIPDSAMETMDRVIDGLGVSDGFVVINPGAGWDSRLWPAERYSEVAKHVANKHGLPSVVSWAGPREEKWAEQIVAGSSGQAVMPPATSLMHLAALMQKGSLYIGSDTGPMHMAVAVETPVICLHGTTRPQDSGPYGTGHIPIQKRYHGGTSRQRRRACNDAMQLITAEQVCQASDTILNRPDKTVRPRWAA